MLECRKIIIIMIIVKYYFYYYVDNLYDSTVVFIVIIRRTLYPYSLYLVTTLCCGEAAARWSDTFFTHWHYNPGN